MTYIGIAINIDLVSVILAVSVDCMLPNLIAWCLFDPKGIHTHLILTYHEAKGPPSSGLSS